MDVVVFWDFSDVSLCIYNGCFVVAMGFFFFNRKKKQCGCGIFIMDCKVYSKGLTIFHSPILLENMLSYSNGIQWFLWIPKWTPQLGVSKKLEARFEPDPSLFLEGLGRELHFRPDSACRLSGPPASLFISPSLDPPISPP